MSDSKTDDSPLLGCFVVMMSFASIGPAILWRAYVFVTLWSWFVVETWGLEPLAVPLVAGIDLLRQLAFYRNTVGKESPSTERIALATTAVFFHPAVALALGWWFHGLK